ncbi:FAD-dependent monooxygenase [Streptomyces sp. NPDC035033]|uniref:FAD-dependent monooxygenase n=1 Tax=Streptomyces sp. NPDC035033 TaxID=3155368 RepID=UPI0033F62C77
MTVTRRPADGWPPAGPGGPVDARAGGPVEETEVLVVGGGPVGLALGLDLALRGVGFVLVEAGDGRITHPKVSTVGPRAMELFRRWGVADAIRAAGWPPGHTRDVAWVTAVGGHELHRLRFAPAGERPLPAYTPEPEAICPQHWLVPLLLERLGVRPEGPVRLGTRLTGFVREADGVRAALTDAAGARTSVRARYLVGCDGAASPVRKACGIAAPERHATRTLRNVLFRAPDLADRLGARAALVHFVTEPGGLRYPLRAMDGRGLYRLTCPPGPADALRVVRRALAVDVPVEVVSDTEWHLTHRVAARYRDGRVLLAGDAAHTLSPSGGFGLATGIGDAADLGWKLAAELAGWAGPGLLDTYGSERRPVALAGLEESHRNLRRTLDRRLSAALLEDSPRGEEARAALGRQIAASAPRREFDAPDAHFSHRYRSPVIAEEKAGDAGPEAGAGPEPDGPVWNRTAVPGGRAPHAWLAPGRSTLDLFDRAFTLLRLGPDGPEGVDGTERAFAERRVPLRVERVRAQEAVRRYGHPFVLVRPDGHVAWRGHRPPADPGGLADLVRGAGSRPASGADSGPGGARPEGSG